MLWKKKTNQTQNVLSLRISGFQPPANLNPVLQFPLGRINSYSQWNFCLSGNRSIGPLDNRVVPSPRESLYGMVWQRFFLRTWHCECPHLFSKLAHPGDAPCAFLALFLHDSCLTLRLQSSLLETKLGASTYLAAQGSTFSEPGAQIAGFCSVSHRALKLNAINSADGVNSKNVEGNRAGEIACDYYLRAGWSTYWRGSSWEPADPE